MRTDDQEKANKYTQVEHELADDFIYLLDSSNIGKIELFKAFRGKEVENHKRFWIIGNIK